MLSRFSFKPQHAAFLLIFATFIAYGMHLGNSFVDFDDEAFISQNPLITKESFVSGAIHSFTMPHQYLYIPLTMFSWKLTASIFGLNAFWFHLSDLFLHIINVLLVWGIMEYFTKKRGVALFAALIFAVHPLNVEAVLWASARKDLLSATFALLSIGTYILSLETEAKKWKIWSIVLFILGLLSKVGIAPLPFVLLLIDLVKHKKITKNDLLWKIPYLIPAILLGYVALKSGQEFLDPVPLGTLLLLGTRSLTLLIQLFFWPSVLNPLRLQTAPVVLADQTFFLSAFLVGVLLLLCVVLYFTPRGKRGILGIGWMLLFIAPTFLAAEKAGLLYEASEKYFYLPMIGLLLIGGVLITMFLQKFPIFSIAVGGVASLMVIGFGMRTMIYGAAWHSSEELYEHILVDNPDHPVALASLAFRYDMRRKPEEALQLYRHAIDVDPSNTVPYLNSAGIYFRQGKIAEASAILEEMLPHATARQMQGDAGVREMFVLAADRLERENSSELAKALMEKGKELDPGAKEFLPL